MNVIELRQVRNNSCKIVIGCLEEYISSVEYQFNYIKKIIHNIKNMPELEKEKLDTSNYYNIQCIQKKTNDIMNDINHINDFCRDLKIMYSTGYFGDA